VTTTPTRSAASKYARFLGLAVAVVVVLCTIGVVPTRRLAGDEGVAGMFAGCAIGLMSAALAGLLLVAMAAETPEAQMKRSFLAMTVRLAVVVALGAAAALSDVFPTQPLLLWIGFSYMALLPLEVRLAIYG
jgi:nitrate reductase gamma subunit